MYSFTCFTENDRQTIVDFIEAYPFAFLTGSFLCGKQAATQVPVMLEQRNGEFYLQGHIMRNTDHHKAFLENPNALVVFTGPNAYVSASWYANLQIGSTWNYMSVYISGPISFMNDEDLIQLMRKQTLKFERGNTRSLTFYDNLPEQFLNKMMPAITGFEIKGEEVKNVFKLSQNRDEQSYINVTAQLEQQGGNSALVAGEMKKRKAALFPPGVEWDGSRFAS